MNGPVSVAIETVGAFWWICVLFFFDRFGLILVDLGAQFGSIRFSSVQFGSAVGGFGWILMDFG